MRVALVAAGIPNPTSGGGALTSWSIVNALLDHGHSVGVCIIDEVHASASRQLSEQLLSQLSALNVTISRIVSGRAQKRAAGTVPKAVAALRDPLSFAYPTAQLAGQVEEQLALLSPDAIFIYHFEALATAYRTSIAPKMVGVGDPTHLPDYYRWRRNPLSLRPRHLLRTASMLYRLTKQPAMMRMMMNCCQSAGAFAAHHAEWYRRRGVRHCEYLRTPVPDPVGASWRTRRQEASGDAEFKLVLIGHLRGIATLSGLDLFAREVLPILERSLGRERFQVHIVGGYAPPADLARLLDRPNVLMRGHVEPADDEFLSAHVIVVPTPIPLGIRVRILSAWSFGCCVVSHIANVSGIPEIVHDENALLASTGSEMAECILRALRDPKLRSRLQFGSRRTFERYFSIQAADGMIVGELERIAGKHRVVREGEGRTITG